LLCVNSPAARPSPLPCCLQVDAAIRLARASGAQLVGDGVAAEILT
jgi:hypothetical protein